jgi:hypothetical protein
VSVPPAPPVARFTVSADPCPKELAPPAPNGSTSVLRCTFDGTGSTGANLTYTWTIGGSQNQATGATLANFNPQCGFAGNTEDGGEFLRDVILVVRDSLGRSNALTREVRFRQDGGC